MALPCQFRLLTRSTASSGSTLPTCFKSPNRTPHTALQQSQRYIYHAQHTAQRALCPSLNVYSATGQWSGYPSELPHQIGKA